MLKEKYKQIKIPKTVKIVFCNKKNILILTGPKNEKVLRPVLKIFLSVVNEKTAVVNVTLLPTETLSKNKIKKIKSIQGQLVALIRNALQEVTQVMYKRLNLIGVGYRIIPGIEGDDCTDFILKLGFSHLIYYKLPDQLTVRSTKYNKLTLFGFSNDDVAQTAARIRLLKSPEPYKGKGVLYHNEKITTKVGKRV